MVTASLFAVGSAWFSGAIATLCLGLYALPGRGFLRQGIAGLRMLWPFLALIALWHGVTGTFEDGIAVALQLLAAVGFANLVTLTTRLEDLAAVVTKAASPLRRFGLRPERFGLALALVVRFAPVLTQRGNQITDAWRSRSARRPGWQTLAPLTLAAIDDATYVAEALRARGGIDPVEEQ